MCISGFRFELFKPINSELVIDSNFNIMKSTFNQTLSALLLTVIVILAPACKKDDEKDTDTNSARYDALAQAAFNDLADVADQAVGKGNLNGFRIAAGDETLADCATVTLDTSTSPKTCTVDFGTGCTGNDGKVRAGKIIITFTGPYKAAGTVITITPDNYSVNGNVVSGQKTITNNGVNSSGFLSYTVVVNGQINLANNAGTITWQANRTREFIEGAGTIIFADDVYRISGTSSGTKVNGASWTSEITSPLIRKISCHQFVSGVLVITPSDKPQRTIDFGSGNCDNTATVTINGNTFTITII